MRLKTFYNHYMYRSLLTFVFCAILAIDVNIRSGSHLPLWLPVLSSLLFTMFVTLFDLLEKKLLLLIVTLAVLILGILLLYRLEINVIANVREAFSWLLFCRQQTVDYVWQFAVISIEIFLFLAVILFFYLFRFWIVRWTLASGLLMAMIITGVIERNLYFITLLFMFFFILSVLIEFVLGSTLALTHILPVILLMSIMITVLPTRHEPLPIPWSEISNGVWNRMTDVHFWFLDRFPGQSGGEFQIGQVGFADDGSLGGGLLDSDAEALRVESENPAQILYLSGSVMDTYTGRGWERSQNMDMFAYPEYQLAALELLTGLYKAEQAGLIGMEWIQDNVTLREMTIHFSGIRTRNIFLPAHTLSISRDVRMDTRGATLFFSRTMSDVRYTVQYLILNDVNYFVLQQMMQGSGNLADSSLDGFADFVEEALGTAIPQLSVPDNLNEILQARSEKIYYYYTQLPDGVSDRVYELSEVLVAHSEDYVSGMRTIERFLYGDILLYTSSQEFDDALQRYTLVWRGFGGSFTYTRNPEPVGEGEFVDWFLFEGQQGFCTHFATAAATLGRAAGIPVRYVQGFVTQTNVGITVIRDNQAHAWVEAYIKGIGWIPFEPTPPYAALPLQGETWVSGEHESQEYAPDVYPPQSPMDQDEFDSPFGQEAQDGNGYASSDGDGVQVTPIYQRILLVALFIIIFMVLLLGVGVYCSYIKNNRVYRKYSLEKRFRRDFREIMFLLGLHGYEPRAGETLKMFAENMQDAEFDQVLKAHEKVVYQRKELEAKTAWAVNAYKRSLAKKINGRVNKLRYVLHISGK
ncbi:MAG: DUF3488 and transglutaminase-like domain-containing protein [Lachnospiraceae bacterium]|nr:DUF3488 and transglutaminase-like domain-containing protein [Lachnospiraceae bacterium]